MTDWSTYTDEELAQAAAEIDLERNRRWQIAEIPKQMVTMNEQWMAQSTDFNPGEAWVRPTGAHNAYPKDWVATHNSKTWVSTVDSNVWEPGVSGWKEQTAPGEEWPPWMQPTGAHDDYDIGAKVSHNSKHWVSAINANVWEPGAVGSESLWTEQP